MRRAALVAACALLPVSTVSAYQWPQTNGGRTRAGVWPPTAVPGNVGATGPEAQPPAAQAAEPLVLSEPREPPVVTAPRLGGLPFPVTTLKSLEFEVPQVFK